MRGLGLGGEDWARWFDTWAAAFDPDRWSALAAHRGAAERIGLPAWDADSAVPPAPIYVEGAAPPWAIVRAFGATRPGELGAGGRVCVVEPDPSAVLDALAHDELAEAVASDRVAWFVGPRALERLERDLLDRLDGTVAGTIVRSPGSGRESSGAVAGVVERAVGAQREAMSSVSARLGARHAGRDAAWWAGRYRDALAGRGEPLRALVITSRFSTYVGAAGEDIAAAFARAGAESRTLIEPDACSGLTSLGVARAVDEFGPDLVVTVNHPRARVARSIPAGIPLVCWVQDPMPHLFTPDGARPGRMDFFVGHRYAAMGRLGLSADRLLVSPVLASGAKFRAEPAVERRCEIAIVSNHGASPGDLAARLAVGYGLPPAMGARLASMVGEIERLSREPMARPVEPALAGLAAELTGDRSGAEEGPAAKVARHVLRPVADRAIRHAAFGWAAALAERRGWRLEVHGRGWGSHPTLARHVRGVAAHGEELRRVYAGAAVTLHASSGWPVHQRVIECALSGGLPAVMVKAGDLDALQSLAGETLSREAPPRASSVGGRMAWGSSADHAGAMWVAAQLQRLRDRLGCDVPAPGLRRVGFEGWFPWADGHGPGGARRGARLVEPWEEAALLGDLAETGFWSEASLGNLVERASADGRWRASAGRWMASRARAGFTYEHAAARILSFVGGAMERSSASSWASARVSA
jgi:hypothetical protein